MVSSGNIIKNLIINIVLLTIFIFTVFILGNPASASKYYVVERAGGSLGVISHNVLKGQIKRIGNGTHIIVYFGKTYGYAISRNGYLSKIDPVTDKIILQKKVSSDTVDFCLSKNLIAVADYKPENVVILNKEFKVLKTVNTGSRTIGVEFYKHYLVFELMDKDQIWVVNLNNFKVIKKISHIGKFPIDALVSGNDYIAAFLIGQKFGVLNLKTLRYHVVNYGKKGSFPGQIPHYGIYSVYNDRAYIPAVGDRKIVVVNLKTEKKINSLKLAGYPIFIIFSPNRKTIAVNYSGSAHNYLTLIDAKDLKVIKNIKAGKRIMFMAFSGNSKLIYASDYFGNSVNVFNVRNGKEVTVIPVQSPSGIFRVPKIGIKKDEN
ncbi:MAG: NirF protein [Deltaproteobacteria bacterium]|nr:NirF protein [Deltaproteobacteria bacterium]